MRGGKSYSFQKHKNMRGGVRKGVLGGKRSKREGCSSINNIVYSIYFLGASFAVGQAKGLFLAKKGVFRVKIGLQSVF